MNDKEYTREEAEAIFAMLKDGKFKFKGEPLPYDAILKARDILGKPQPDKIIISPYLDKN